MRLDQPKRRRPALSHARSLVLICGLMCVAPSALAQFGLSGASVAYDLSDTVLVDEADSTVRAALDRIKAYVNEQQWDEAVEGLRQCQSTHGAKLIKIDEQPWIPALKGRWITVADYCNLRIASLPPAGLELYRNRVDPAASKLYQRGIADRDPQPLRTIVAEMFASRFGDRALNALAEMSLERGDANAARGYWESISRDLKSNVGGPLWAASNLPSAAWLAYPDSGLNLDTIRARLVWVSILQGDIPRATAELASFKRQHPDAVGRLAGVEGNLADTLSALLAAAAKWPAAAPAKGWATFAGNDARNRSNDAKIEVGHAAWEKPIELRHTYQSSIINSGGGSRVAESVTRLMSYFPVATEKLLIFNDEQRVYAFDLATGLPAWPVKKATDLYRPGQIYKTTDATDAPIAVLNAYGVPRFAPTVSGQRLYARLGTPITSRTMESMALGKPGELVCLDLAQNGKLLWQRPESGNQLRQAKDAWFDQRWSFEGAPLADDRSVYVVMRYSDVRPQVHVAALDAATGEPRWRRRIAAAETPTRGVFEEVTSTMLSRDHDMLYLSTNLGAVAAITTSGQIKWVTHYARSSHDDDRIHFYRDLTPCVIGNGLIYVAPSDNRGIFALDALTGQIVWYSSYATDTVHLLGVAEGKLVATGNKVWIFDARNGKALFQFPDSPESEGWGRGLLAGGHVYWPTHTHIRRFDLKRMAADDLIDLEHRGYDSASGGNLLTAGGRLIVATPERIFSFSPQAGKSPGDTRELTRSNSALPPPLTAPR